MLKPQTLFFLASFFLACSGVVKPALAVAVTNLTDKPQLIQMPVAGGWQDITIAAGETWRIPGKTELRHDGRQVSVEDDQEFAIWPNGDFGPQRKLTRGTGDTSQ